MIETGIPKLDEYLDGGIPTGKSLVYLIHPGVEGDVFGMQSLYHNLEKGVKGIYVTSTASPHAIRDRFEELGWDLNSHRDHLIIVDAYSALIGQDSEERYLVEDPEDTASILKTVEKALEENPRGLLVCESLSNIMDLAGEEDTLQLLQDFHKVLVLYDTVSICNFTAWPYSDETIRRIKDELFNAVVKVGGIAERVIFGQYYGVSKVDWTQTKDATMLFRVIKPGGVKAFIPKILVTGPYHAGKSTFIHSISTRAVSVNRLGTTIALDHGHIEHRGISADIFGTPGQERFDPILKLLGGEALGVFLVVDSTQPTSFPRAKTMLELTKTFGLPTVVIANKQDLSGAMKPDDLRDRMKLPRDIPILPAVATSKTGVTDAFEMLLKRIMEGL
ncbi:MAG: GTP-binding protein [Euryarchaeota archaeon]|nr:GTP-binding protein [Euryarchaeota archaeon]